MNTKPTAPDNDSASSPTAWLLDELATELGELRLLEEIHAWWHRRYPNGSAEFFPSA